MEIIMAAQKKGGLISVDYSTEELRPSQMNRQLIVAVVMLTHGLLWTIVGLYLLYRLIHQFSELGGTAVSVMYHSEKFVAVGILVGIMSIIAAGYIAIMDER